ncbi:DUF4302 domain-containing protein [Sphingobacterium bovistauri]|uniref:DUF4302 domain-containing protein n=1 Tax=Sphingobacterium bovistauri TaxID=2781959 RepID=A0ABS7Z4G2_9SPHI|nr:DUF4302 domain-containing protein [Sphingobacterium bovistauri]MCA5004301.1 DUF4302 domain-containing protein [Sphingobacterium bovistauri]
MKKYNIIYMLAVLLFALVSCEKDEMQIKKEDIFASVDKKELDLKEALGATPEGWVMMVKGTASRNAYFPIIMKFDTAKNLVSMVSPFGIQANNKSTYLINRGASGVVLNFSGGSAISALMRRGAYLSDITDYQFNVLDVKSDTLTIQGIRSGPSYAKEGGVIYKLFKKPVTWNWDGPLELDFRQTTNHVYINKWSRVNLKNHLSGDSLFVLLNINPNSYNQASWSVTDAFLSDASSRVFDPHFLMNGTWMEAATSSATAGLNTTVYGFTQGYNSLTVFQTWGSNTLNVNNPLFNTKYGFSYLVYNKVTKSGNNALIELEAYDKQGKPIVSGVYTVYP